MAGVNLYVNKLSKQFMKTPEDVLLSFASRQPAQNDPYTYEHGGMLVYECNFLTQETPVFTPKSSQHEVARASLRDRKAFQNSLRLRGTPRFEVSRLKTPEDGVTLSFDSRFESGNLRKAVKLSDYDYLLFLRNDTNASNNHWYYFSVTNPRSTAITFKICNMLKQDVLYKAGMKPAVFSTKHHQLAGIGWQREGSAISYCKNQSQRGYTLSFTYRFLYPDDTVFVAYSVPYTYAQLLTYLQQVSQSDFARVSPLCKTLGGANCPLITITSDISSYTSHETEARLWGISAGGRRLLRRGNEPSIHSDKRGIVLTARVHSGETVSSYMMQGALDFLLSNEAQALRRQFVIKVVPMLNIDGVRFGNDRASLLGVDLNRTWLKPSKVLHPTVFYSKKMIEVFNESHEVALYCDMHGHSRKRNVFMYGCNTRAEGLIEMRKNLLSKVFPVILPIKNPLFSFKDSHFRIEDDKKTTARVVVHSQFGVAHSYTLEASFYGPSTKEAFGEGYAGDLHMSTADLEKVGRDLCSMCLMFTKRPLYFQRINYTNNFLRRLVFEKVAKGAKEVAVPIYEEQGQKELGWDDIDVVDYSSSGEQGGGSDLSDEQEKEESSQKEEIKEELIQQIKEAPKSPKLPRERRKKATKFVLKNISEASRTNTLKTHTVYETSRIRMPILASCSDTTVHENSFASVKMPALKDACRIYGFSVQSDQTEALESSRPKKNRWGSTYLRRQIAAGQFQMSLRLPVGQQSQLRLMPTILRL